MSESPAPASPPAVPHSERLHALDNLRAVAMTLGIFLHAAISFMAMQVPWAIRDVRTHWSFDLMAVIIHGFRMQLFFFLAGFFARLLYLRFGPAGFLQQRGLRIGVPFVAGMVLLIPLLGLIFVWGGQHLGDPRPLPANPSDGLRAIPTAHLWFLQYLLIHYAAAAALVWLTRQIPASFETRLDDAFDRLLHSPLRALPLVPPVVLCLWNGPMFGEVENAGFSLVPNLRAVISYGIFFTAGWWLHRRRHQLTELAHHLKTGFALAGVALLVHVTILVGQPKPTQPEFFTLKLTSLACAALYAWAMTFALTGWFLRFAGQHSPQVRYLADASYWCYLLHLPLVAVLQILAARWPVNPWLKFAGINLVTMTLLLASYRCCVRYTWVGRLLNGPREK